jgi:SpoVK/Ycf46/Vps4 family AAA+-type ATPase
MNSRPPDLAQTLVRALSAGARGIALTTDEEDRAVELCEQVGERLGWPVHTWSAAEGIDGDGGPRPLADLVAKLRREADDALWVLLDAPAAVTDALTRRGLRALAQRVDGPAFVLVQPADGADPSRTLDIPELLVERLPLPDARELDEHVRWIAGLLEEGGHAGARTHLAAGAPAVAAAALGLGLRDLERMVAEAVSTHGPDVGAVVAHVAGRKAARLDRHGVLEIAAPVPADEVGGLPALKAWLRRRALALRPDAYLAAIPPPRGVLLLGVQGCGKSLAARACADILGLPLVRLDPGRLFGETVGRSEANLRRAIDLVERLAPTVLWLDEIDKGLAGADGSASDGGTAARVIGGLLTWMQERERPVFVVATANRIDTLPPELLRRGRLDETFFVDLPDAEAREDVLRVHLLTRPSRALPEIVALADPWPTFAAVARSAEGVSGAEIEAALIEARLDAFAEQRPLQAADLRHALAATVPLSRTRAEEIDALRRWAKDRARPA